MMHVQLPVRKEITLFEAVTAFVYGKPRDPSSEPFHASDAEEPLLERLHQAAHAGLVRFRALQEGNNNYQEIDPLYFGTRRTLNWNNNRILSWGYNDEGDEVYFLEWYDVHLDREQFASLLKHMGVSIEQSTVSPQQPIDDDVPGKHKTFETGAPGRPTSKHLVVAEAARRIAAGGYPKTLAEFSRQLAEWLQTTEELAAPMTPRTIENAVRDLWNERPTKF
jgi:hypothetical protein